MSKNKYSKPDRRLFLTGTAALCLVTTMPSLSSSSRTKKHDELLDVTRFGAAKDGTTLNTEAIQKAIDHASMKGGGTVHFPSGTYLTGTLELKTNVKLELAEGATLLGSSKLSDYRRGHWPALIMAKNQSNIGILGAGTINGNSENLIKEFDRILKSDNALDFFPHAVDGENINVIGPTGSVVDINPYEMQRQGKLMSYVYSSHQRPNEFVRPQVIEFWACKNIVVEDVTLRNAACWVQTYRDCEDVSIKRQKVRSTKYWNNDGIDIVDCQRVKIFDCDIHSADDAICFKSDPRGNGCADIMVKRCKLSSHASAIKFGTASHHGFKDITISDLYIYDTYRSVVAIQSVDGGLIENLLVEKVKAVNTGNAVFIRLGHRSKHKKPGRIRNITLRDFEVDVPPLKPDYHSESGTPHNLIPSSIVGMPGHLVEKVLLENITITYGGGADRSHTEITLDAIESIPEKLGDYPEFSMFGELPAWGFIFATPRKSPSKILRYHLYRRTPVQR